MSAFYHAIIKKTIIAFGAVFSNIHIIRRKDDSVTGKIIQDIKVPIAYSAKEKWFEALFSDPTREKQTKMTLPRMAFELTGLTYDSTRKTTRSSTITCASVDGTATQMATPAPWNISFNLYLVANSQEDLYQMLEQILPIFNPDRTIKIKVVPEMNIVQNIPISLNGVTLQDNFDSEINEQRLQVCQLSFVAKINFYGEVTDTVVISEIDANLGNETATITYESNSNKVTMKWNMGSGEYYNTVTVSNDMGGAKVICNTKDNT